MLQDRQPNTPMKSGAIRVARRAEEPSAEVIAVSDRAFASDDLKQAVVDAQSGSPIELVTKSGAASGRRPSDTTTGSAILPWSQYPGPSTPRRALRAEMRNEAKA